jgi:hypothetical protein
MTRQSDTAIVRRDNRGQPSTMHVIGFQAEGSGAVGRGILLQDAKALRDYGGKYHHCACCVRIKYKGQPDKPYQKGIGVTDREST